MRKTVINESVGEFVNIFNGLKALMNMKDSTRYFYLSLRWKAEAINQRLYVCFNVFSRGKSSGQRLFY